MNHHLTLKLIANIDAVDCDKLISIAIFFSVYGDQRRNVNR